MKPPAPVLYAEDDENDIFLLRRAFRKAEISNRLEIVTDGQMAVDYLAGTGEYANREKYPFPELLLLDLNLPRQSELDVLEWIRATPAISKLPVLMLSSSNQKSDIEQAYALGVSSYLVKTGKPNHFLAMIQSIKQFWLTDCAQ